MADLCSKAPGLCMHDPACPKYDCEGHPLAMQMLRRPGFLHVQDGSHCASGENSDRIPAEAATEQSDSFGYFILILAGVLAALLVAASAFDLRFPT